MMTWRTSDVTQYRDVVNLLLRDTEISQTIGVGETVTITYKLFVELFEDAAQSGYEGKR